MRHATTSRLVASFTHLAPTNVGELAAHVSVSSTWISGKASCADCVKDPGLFKCAVVSKVIARTPTLTAHTGVISSDAAQLTIVGKGFDAWQQKRQFNSCPNEECINGGKKPVDAGKLVNKVIFAQWTQSAPYNPVKGLVSSATMTQLIVSFTHLAPTNWHKVHGGALNASVTVSATWGSAARQVAKVRASNPTVYHVPKAAGLLSSSTITLTIAGKGFDATATSKAVVRMPTLGRNVVRLRSDSRRACRENTFRAQSQSECMLPECTLILGAVPP